MQSFLALYLHLYSNQETKNNASYFFFVITRKYDIIIHVKGDYMEYNFKINDFEGPLDLLLHLIKEQDMDIMNIEIVKLTDQYLDFIDNMKEKNLNIASEYLILASELMYIKSKSLLPNIKDEEEQEELTELKENLINRLLEYEQYKKITQDFKELEEQRHEFYTKSPSNLKEYIDPKQQLSDDITLEDLLKAFQNYLKRQQIKKPITTKITTKEISIEERTKSIKNILKTKRKVEFFDLFEDISKPYVVVTFLSILEMAKNNELKITQENNFDKIYCEVA